jgi:hypothetical protein
MEVAPLSNDASEALLRHLLGVSDERFYVEQSPQDESGDDDGAAPGLVPQVVLNIVAQLGEGNPKLIRELVHCMVDQGLVEKADQVGEPCILAENLSASIRVEKKQQPSIQRRLSARGSLFSDQRDAAPRKASREMDEFVAEIFDNLKLSPQLMQHALGKLACTLLTCTVYTNAARTRL